MKIFGTHEEATLAQLRDVASRAERAALMADGHVGYVMPIGGVAAYRDRVSVVGVGFDIACLAAGTPVGTRDGYHVAIEQVRDHTPATCWDGERVRAIAPLVGAVSRGTRAVERVRLANGRHIVATPDHRVLTRDGWREAGTLAAGDRVGCQLFVGLPLEPYDVALALPVGSAFGVAELRDRGLLPLRTGDARFPALVRLLGCVSGDGHLSKDGRAVSVYTVHERDAPDIAADFARLGFMPSIYRRERGTGRRVEVCVRVASTALHALLAAMGSPVGRKRWPEWPMPWLLEAPAWVRAQFLSAFASAEMTTPRRHANGVVPNLQLKQAGEDAHAIDFVARLCESLGFAVSVTPSGPAYDGRQAHVLQILGGQAAQVAFAERVGFCYAAAKRAAAAEVASIVWARATLVDARVTARDEARALHIAGAGWRDVTRGVAARHGVSAGFVYHAIYSHRGAPRRLPGAATAPETTGELCWVPVESVAPAGELPVYDVVTGDAAGCFFAAGLVVHNCGNAAIRTNLTMADLGSDAEAQHRTLTRAADEIQRAVSFGVGRKNRADDAPVDHPLFHDDAWAAVPVKERTALKTKARQQLGTVGSGNHYVDVFADEQGQIWVGVHFGSRGFGHTVASGFLALGQNAKWGDRVPEREVLLDLAAPVGHDYFALMNLAGRYAYAGREWVARKVVEILGGEEVELVHNHHNFCVPADAIVPTTAGPRRMEEIRAGDSVYAFDPALGLVETPVTAHWRSGMKTTRTVGTASRRFAVSDEHPVLVVDTSEEPHATRPWHLRRRGALRWKRADELRVGDAVVCVEGYFRDTDPIGVERARVVGAMLGDGWIRHHPARSGYTVGLAIGNAGESHTARYRELVTATLPPARWSTDAPGAYGLTCSSVDVWKEVQALGLGGYGQEKRVADFAFALPRNEKLALLAGYMDADGSVAACTTSNHGRGAIASTNRDLVAGLRELALGCGLRVTPVRHETRRTNLGPCDVYRCTLGADAVRQLDIWHAKKAGNARATLHRRPQGLAPAQFGYVTFPPGAFVQRVTSVDAGTVAQPVYDLSVAHHSHSFVCDGVVVHNCWKETHEGEELCVVRKGATPAFPGQPGFIGGSMGDDAVIVRGAVGAPNEVVEAQREALHSTVHGAGRVMSRTQAAGKRNRRTGQVITPGRVTPEMMREWVARKGVILRGGGLDESPHAYRRLPEVLAAQGGTVEVLHTLRPLVVVMAGADEFDPYKD